MANPKQKTEKTYWVQVENVPTDSDLVKLQHGVELKDGLTLPAKVNIIESPSIWPRVPLLEKEKTFLRHG